MSTIEEIEKAIEQLPRAEIFRLREKIQERFDDEWDKQIEEDALSGRLDHLAEEAIANFKAKKSSSFPENGQPGDS